MFGCGPPRHDHNHGSTGWGKAKKHFQLKSSGPCPIVLCAAQGTSEVHRIFIFILIVSGGGNFAVFSLAEESSSFPSPVWPSGQGTNSRGSTKVNNPDGSIDYRTVSCWARRAYQRYFHCPSTMGRLSQLPRGGKGMLDLKHQIWILYTPFSRSQPASQPASKLLNVYTTN